MKNGAFRSSGCVHQAEVAKFNGTMEDRLRRQMAGKLSVQLRGIISKSWQSRYCVFLAEANGNSPQIHIYEKEEHYKNNAKERKIFHLDGIKKVQNAKEKEFGFDIITKKDKFYFAADNEHDFKLWVKTLKQDLILEPDGSMASDDEESDSHLYMDDNVIYESAEVTPMFSVLIDDNSAAKRCNLTGSYFLVVNLHNLALVDRTTKKAIFQWPYRYIRRFGKTRTNFQFEAGRRCPSGEGEFSFRTEQGFEIFESFSKTTQKIRSQGEEGSANPLRMSGGAQAMVHTKTDKVSPTPVKRGTSEGNQSPGSQTDRRSVKSGGHIGSVPGKFASELNNVLMHHKDSEQLKPSAKMVSQKSLDHVPEEGKSGKKDKHKSDKKSSEKPEKKQKKGKEKEKKDEKKSDKKKARPTVSAPLESEPPLSPSIHAYEEVDEVASRRISTHGPEPLYSEAVDTSKKPTPKPKPRSEPKKPAAKPETVLYSEPQKVRKDAWKEHGRQEEIEHEEDYDQIKSAATSGASQLSKEVEADYDLPADSGPHVSADDDDGTYDHIGNLKPKKTEPESVYGTASAKTIASIQKGKEVKYDYEEALPTNSAKKKAVKEEMNAYDEPLLPVAAALPGQDDEDDTYADIN